MPAGQNDEPCPAGRPAVLLFFLPEANIEGGCGRQYVSGQRFRVKPQFSP